MYKLKLITGKSGATLKHYSFRGNSKTYSFDHIQPLIYCSVLSAGLHVD